MEDKKYIIKKVLNNNTVLALEDSSEKIILGSGVGFGRREGDTLVHGSGIEKIFTLQEPTNKAKFNELMNNVEGDVVSICEEIITMIENNLKENLNEGIHISLIDHINFTLKRLRENNDIVNPFLVETEVLYKREYALAQIAVGMLEKRTGIRIPDGEAGFIALHIHSARNKGNLSKTIKYTYITNIIVKFVEDNLKIILDKESINYARFVIHLRFTIERLINNNPIRNELLGAIRRKFKNSYRLSEKIGKILEENLNVKAVPDEIGYIAIHLENLVQHQKDIQV